MTFFCPNVQQIVESDLYWVRGVWHLWFSSSATGWQRWETHTGPSFLHLPHTIACSSLCICIDWLCPGIHTRPGVSYPIMQPFFTRNIEEFSAGLRFNFIMVAINMTNAANASQGSELYLQLVFCRSSRAWAWMWILPTGILLQVKEMLFHSIQIMNNLKNLSYKVWPKQQIKHVNLIRWDVAMLSSFVLPQVNAGSERNMYF